jgi:PAS domain S-box-containing protein
MVSELDKPEIYRRILESLQTGIYLVDTDQKILFWNEGAERITGHLRQDVLGRFCVDDLLGNRDGHDSFAADAADAIAAVLRDGKPVAINVSLCHKEGHRVLVRLRAVAIRDSYGKVIGAAESFEESLSVSSWDRRQGKLAVFGCIDEESGGIQPRISSVSAAREPQHLQSIPDSFQRSVHTGGSDRPFSGGSRHSCGDGDSGRSGSDARKQPKAHRSFGPALRAHIPGCAY